MGATSYEVEMSSTFSPERLFNAILKAQTLLPQIIPQAFKSIEVLEGTGGPGTITNLTFAEGLPYTHAKTVIEALDTENFTLKYSMIEGDFENEKLEKITKEVRVVSGSDGGSVFKVRTEFHTIGEAVMSEEEMNKEKEQGGYVFKSIEAYVLANPDLF